MSTHKGITNSVFEPDSVDKEFLLLITRGYISSWSIASYYENTGIKTMVYKNINRRILILAKEEFIEEVPYAKRTPHGRIDYQLTMIGFRSLIPHFLSHTNEIQGLVKYIDKFGLDKIRVAAILIDEHVKSIEALNEFQKHSDGIPYDPFKDFNYEELESIMELRGIIQLQEVYDNRLRKLQSETQISLKHIQDSRVRIRDATGELKSKDIKISKKLAERELDNKKGKSTGLIKAISESNQTMEEKEMIKEAARTLDETVDAANEAGQKTVGAASPLASGFAQIRNPLGQLNTQINSTAATLPKMASTEQQAAQTAESFSQTVEELGERAHGFQDTVKRTSHRKKKH